MAQIPVKSVSSQQVSQESPATSSFMFHPDIVQIHERFNHEMSKMQQKVADMIQDMFGFFAEEFEQVTIKILAAQELNSSNHSFEDITQSTVNVRPLNYGVAVEQQTSIAEFESDQEQQRIESTTSFDNNTESVKPVKTSNHFSAVLLEPKDEQNECTVEEIPLSIGQYFSTTLTQEVVEMNRETEIDRDNEMIENEEDTAIDRDNEMIGIEEDTEIDEHHGIEIDDRQDGEIDEGSEMNISQNGENKSSCGIETISLRCDINGCEYMANEKQIFWHKRETHGVRQYQCRICDPIISFDNKQHLGDHIKRKHSRLTDFRCDQCGQTIRKYSSYKVHKYLYHDTGLFRCSAPDCAFEHSKRQQVYLHIRHQHKQYECKFAGCGQSFYRKNMLEWHERIHLQMRPYSCAYSDHCNYASTNRNNVIRHIRSVHFHLPRSQKKQRELNIIDQRDASEFLRVDEDLLWVTMDSTLDPNRV